MIYIVFLPDKVHVHVDSEISLLRIYYKGKIGIHKGLTRALVMALFIMIARSWKQRMLSVGELVK